MVSAESSPGDYTAFAVMPTFPDDYPTVLYLVSKKREIVLSASRQMNLHIGDVLKVSRVAVSEISSYVPYVAPMHHRQSVCYADNSIT